MESFADRRVIVTGAPGSGLAGAQAVPRHLLGRGATVVAGRHQCAQGPGGPRCSWRPTYSAPVASLMVLDYRPRVGWW